MVFFNRQDMYSSCTLIFVILSIDCTFKISRALQTNEQHHPNTYLSFSDDLDQMDTCSYDTCLTDEIVIRVKRRMAESEVVNLAEKHGHKFIGQVGSLERIYLLKRIHGRAKRSSFQPIFDDVEVEWAQIQLPKKRVKRDLQQMKPVSTVKLPWPDPLYAKQWYLRSGGKDGYDMRVREAWKLGFSGKGIVVSILDDGIQGSHPDLAANYDPLASTDINGGDDDPYPRDNGDNKHGTRCAGEVASVAGNEWCGVGIAYNARIGGVRMLDGPVSDRVEGAALGHNQNHVDIYSASWGPDDDGQTFDGPGALAKMAFLQGVNKGRKGKGNIFIWASGNGGSYQDSCSCDGYTTSIYTLSVSSATFENGQPWYLEECPSTLCTTYSSANRGQPAIISTDMPNSCTEQHTGTSASAPIAAAIVALALEANVNLTWRDMQHLVVRTSNPTPLLDNPGWSKNAVGRMVSNKFGYGLMDAEALVKLAKRWKTAPPHRVCTFNHRILEPEPLRGKFVKNYTLYVSGRCLHTSVLYLEHVQSLISIQFKRRGDLYIVLTSPRGTRSVLLPPRPRDNFRSGFQKWPFLSVQQWGENPEGFWTLTVANVGNEGNTGTFHDWSLTLYGTDRPPEADQLDESDGSFRNNNGAAGGVADISPSTADDDASLDVNGGRSHHEGTKISHENCHQECSSEGCYVEHSALDCVSCLNFQQFLRNRGGVKCVAKCDTGYYADQASKRCNQCWSGCATCSSAQYCDTCPSGTFLVDIDPEHFHHGKCASRCPEGYVNVTESGNVTNCVAVCGRDCLTCEDGTKCRYCKENFYMSPARQCLTICPESFFPNKDTRKCEECMPDCVSCSERGQCLKCAVGFVLNASASKCELEKAQPCKIARDCPSGQYCEFSGQICQVCHTDCIDCIGPAFDQCTSCRNGQPMDSRTRQCLPCHMGQYYKADTGDCLPCDKSCSVCRGSGRTQCVNCSIGYKQYGSFCEPCCKEPDSRSHGKYCVPCFDQDDVSGSKSSTVSFFKIIAALLIAGFTFSLLLLAFLTCRDRNYASGAKKYAYSKIPTDSLNMDNENKLLIGPRMHKKQVQKHPNFLSLEAEEDLLSENSDDLEDEHDSGGEHAFLSNKDESNSVQDSERKRPSLTSNFHPEL